MQTIDLKKIMAFTDLKVSQVAPHVFPDNRDPANALRRAIRGEYLLNSEQIARLSQVLNIPIGLLFDDAAWKMSVPAGRRNVINFRTYDYFAELDTATMITTVSRSGEPLFQKFVAHEKGIGLTEYLSQLTDLIIKHK